MKKLTSTLTFLSLFAWQAFIHAATVTLAWDASSGATGYKLYESTDNSTFSSVGTTSELTFSRTATVTTRYYVTAFNSAGESGPSNIAVWTAPTPGPSLVFTTPVLSKQSVARTESVSVTASIHNVGGTGYSVTDGSLVFLEPGATRDTGPYRWATPFVTPQTIAPNGTLNYSGVWTPSASDPLGTWNVYLVVTDGSGVWLASPFATITVTAAPTPTSPPPPVNLRITGTTTSSVGLQWDAVLDGESVSVFYSEASTTNFKLGGSVAYPRSTFTKTGLKRNRLYYFKANRRNSVGTSDYTATIAARTK